MLDMICAECHNYFVVPGGIHYNNYSIQGGSLELPFLVHNQYFRIVGSVFNDGIHKYPTTDLIDEDFEGCIWAMAPTKDFLQLCDDIKAWSENNAPSPYTSESFGGYSYSRATKSNGVAVDWQQVFASRLNRYRKIR